MRLAVFIKRLSVNRMAAGSLGASWIFFLSATFQTYCPNLTSLAGWCPTDLQHLCCKALINKLAW